MNSITNMVNTVQLFIIGGFLCIVSVILLYLYMVKIKKVTTYEEKIDYHSFKKKDAKEYLKYDGIVSCGGADDPNGAGMIVLDKNTFVAAIRIYGTEFFDSTSTEQDYVIANSVAFMQTIGEPVQFRGHVKKIDVKKEYEENLEAAKNITRTMDNLKIELSTTLEEMEDYLSDEYEAEYNARKERCDAINKQLAIAKLDLEEAMELAREYENYQDAQFKPEHVNYIVYSFHYKEEEHTVTPGNKDELYMLALRTLIEKGKLYAHALEACGCYVKQCNVKDILESILLYINPISAGEKDVEQILSEDYGSLIVHSDTLEKRIKRRIGDKKWEEKLLAYEKELKDALEKKNSMLRKEVETVFGEMADKSTGEQYKVEELYGGRGQGKEDDGQ